MRRRFCHGTILQVFDESELVSAKKFSYSNHRAVILYYRAVLADITPVILTYNESANIGRSLERLTWAREVVIVDSGSTDDTLAIAGRFPNARVGPAAVRHPCPAMALRHRRNRDDQRLDAASRRRLHGRAGAARRDRRPDARCRRRRPTRSPSSIAWTASRCGPRSIPRCPSCSVAAAGLRPGRPYREAAHRRAGRCTAAKPPAAR